MNQEGLEGRQEKGSTRKVSKYQSVKVSEIQKVSKGHQSVKDIKLKSRCLGLRHFVTKKAALFVMTVSFLPA